jgi:uridine kinase
MLRAELLAHLVEAIEGFERSNPVRVAIDGPDAAGKTTLADELASALRARGRPVIRASIDGFHRPRAERYRLGELSPDGYYYDSFDYEALCEALLDPLGPGGSRQYCQGTFDFQADSPASHAVELAPADAVLLFDGVFLLRPELVECWDLRVFVSVSGEVLLRRALARDGSLFGSPDETELRYRRRYMPGQQLYLKAACPVEAADLVVHNDDPARPELESSGRPAGRGS